MVITVKTLSNFEITPEEVFNKLKGSVKEPNMFHNYEIEKITRFSKGI